MRKQTLYSPADPSKERQELQGNNYLLIYGNNAIILARFMAVASLR